MSNRYKLELQYQLKKIVETLRPTVIERIGGGTYSRELLVQVKTKRINIPIISSEFSAKRTGSFQ
jgi:hypothetical protein